MTDAGFVIAAYGVILGGLGLYTLALWRRRRELRRDEVWGEHDERLS